MSTSAIHILSCLSKEGARLFLRADLVIAVCNGKSYIVKSRRDENGVTKFIPSFPELVIAYTPEANTQDQVAVSSVLPLIWRSREHSANRTSNILR